METYIKAFACVMLFSTVLAGLIGLVMLVVPRLLRAYDAMNPDLQGFLIFVLWNASPSGVRPDRI